MIDSPRESATAYAGKEGLSKNCSSSILLKPLPLSLGTASSCGRSWRWCSILYMGRVTIPVTFGMLVKGPDELNQFLLGLRRSCPPQEGSLHSAPYRLPGLANVMKEICFL